MNETNGDYRVLLDLGLSPRQANYWTQRGYIRPINVNPGTGIRRTYPTIELIIALRILKMTLHGFKADAAAVLARSLSEVDFEKLMQLTAEIHGCRVRGKCVVK